MAGSFSPEMQALHVVIMLPHRRIRHLLQLHGWTAGRTATVSHGVLADRAPHPHRLVRRAGGQHPAAPLDTRHVIGVRLERVNHLQLQRGRRSRRLPRRRSSMPIHPLKPDRTSAGICYERPGIRKNSETQTIVSLKKIRKRKQLCRSKKFRNTNNCVAQKMWIKNTFDSTENCRGGGGSSSFINGVILHASTEQTWKALSTVSWTNECWYTRQKKKKMK